MPLCLGHHLPRRQAQHHTKAWQKEEKEKNHHLIDLLKHLQYSPPFLSPILPLTLLAGRCGTLPDLPAVFNSLACVSMTYYGTPMGSVGRPPWAGGVSRAPVTWYASSSA